MKRFTDKRLACSRRQPLGVGFACELEAFRQRLAVLPAISAPPLEHRPNDVLIIEFQGMARLVFRHEDFMYFFAWMNTDQFHPTAGRNGFRKIGDAHAENLWHEYFPSMHLFSTTNDEADACSNVIQNLVMRLSVTVTRPVFLCSRSKGMTLPRLPTTLPLRSGARLFLFIGQIPRPLQILTNHDLRTFPTSPPVCRIKATSLRWITDDRYTYWTEN